MKTKTLFFLGFLLALFFTACNRDDINFGMPSQKLKLSKDTLVLDTVYSQVRSETYLVKIYNNENNDIAIPKIYLEAGTNSPYKLNIDGKPGIDFSNVSLRKKDSLFIFVEIAPQTNATEAIAEDRIQIESPAGQQHITLLSVVQNVDFLISTADNPKILSNNTTWDNTKAKIIYGNLELADGKSLTISEGTKVYFHKNSNLKIGKNAQLITQGSLGKEVIFRGDRNDAQHDTIPLNWGGIQLEQGAAANLNYTKIFGGTTGLELNNASANIKNTIIHTFQEYGILGINATINAENLAMNNCGEANLGIFKGGNYNFLHTTLANYWNLNGALPGYSIYATNEYTNGNNTEQGALSSLNLKNSIIYTDRSNAMFFKPTTGQTFNYLIENCLLKYDNTAGFTFDNNPLVKNSIKNEDPKFENYFIQKLNLRVKTNSPAKAKGIYDSASPKDILGIARTTPPTIGAYQ